LENGRTVDHDAEAIRRDLVCRTSPSHDTRKPFRPPFREVVDALAAYRKTTEQLEQEQLLVDALRESNRMSPVRYQGGLDSCLQVRDSKRNLASTAWYRQWEALS
jgi:hypothetical protein